MSGTREGGLKTARTTKERHGADFYRKIGAKGGKVHVSKGFGVNRELARTAGSKGGKNSKRGPSVKMEESWQTNSTSLNSPTSSQNRLKGVTCASCHKEGVELDDMQLCANCPKTDAPTTRPSGRVF